MSRAIPLQEGGSPGMDPGGWDPISFRHREDMGAAEDNEHSFERRYWVWICLLNARMPLFGRSLF